MSRVDTTTGGKARPNPGAVRRAGWRGAAQSALSALLVGGLVGVVVPSAAAESESAEDPELELECPAEVEQDPEVALADDEAQALALAAACGVPVEVGSARGFVARTWAQPEGHLRSEISAVPQWTRDETGEWVDVDPTLAWEAGGPVRATATVSTIRMSGGGLGPFVTATDPAGGSLSLTWPAPLPTPTLDGDTATYSDVLPDVDLVVTAGVDGFAYGLVVHTPEAAANPALVRVEVSITSLGLNVSQNAHGLVEATNAAGEPVFVSGDAWMWDSSEPAQDLDDESTAALEADDPSPGRVEAMPIELAGGTLAVIPDADMLADPEVVFPVVIDPPFVGSRIAWANVHREQASRGWTNDSAWPRAGGMRVGLCTWSGCGDSWGLWRSAVRFNTEPLGGKYIVSAAVKMIQTHTGGCGTYPLRLYQVSAFSSGVSWNGVNWLSFLQSRDVASSNSIGGCGTNFPNRSVTFNNSAVKGRVQHHANQGHNSISFGVRSGSESDRNQWRRISRDSLRLEVTHASFPQTPTNLSTDGKGCATSGPGPWLTTGRPKLTGTPRNADGNGRYRQEVRTADGTTMVHSFLSPVVTVNIPRTHTVTAADALVDGAYRWRMRTESTTSGVPASSYSSWCYFQVDTTPPAMPWAQVLTDDPQQGEPVQVRLYGDVGDVDKFRYNLTGGANQDVDTGGTWCFVVPTPECWAFANITVTPPTTSIDHQLQVWALDEAGNLSARYDLWFTTQKALRVPVAGVWRFDGDRRDDSGNGHHLTLGADPPLTTDRQGRADSAMRLDGASCVSTTEPVLHTDESFTVAAWVRPDEAESPLMTIMSQPGEVNTAFRLRKGGDNRWAFLMLSEDSGSPDWYTVSSVQEATGQWQHVAGVYDAAAARMRLYVDGVLQGVREAPAAWDATDPLFAGCASSGGFPGWDRFDGDLDDLVAYQGVRTSTEIQELAESGVPAGAVSWWPLRGDGGDAGPAGSDLTVPPIVSWVPDSHGRAGSAMQLDGGSCAATDDPVVRSDSSFTVAAWAKPSAAGARPMTVASQAGVNNTAFRLRITTDNRWSFVVMAADIAQPDWHTVTAPAEATTGGWQHVAGLYDAAAGEIRLYVDGVLQDVDDVPVAIWRSTGGLYVGCAASSGSSWDFFDGAIHDVRVLRGAATPEQVLAVATERVSFWGLDGSGADGWGDHDLSLHGSFEWVDDRFGFPESALGLGFTGDGSAETSGPVVVTDESFTVSAWVRLESTSEWQTLLAQAGNDEVSFSLTYHPLADRWQFAMPSQDSRSAPGWHYVRSLEAPVVGQWYHLVGVYDLGANEISLYVNGELQETVAGPPEPWHVAGELLIGASGDTPGARWDHLVGAVDMVRVYSGVLDPRRIADQGVVPAAPFGHNLIE